ncbi:MAG: hypothetical protein FWC76_03265 [Defluviitaleaceae bacterium]|nr:hypothetical protein [Defluviitaleaceae bacterium]
MLNDYADFCETGEPLLTSAFREHIRETFEGEARKAMKAYKNSMAYIPKDTKIDAIFLGGLTNDEFVTAFRALQKLVYAIYGDVERGSPFEWGWLDWKSITAEGINNNRVIMTLDALVGSSHLDSGVMVVDKKHFGAHAICKPIAKAKLMLKGLMKMGLHIEELDNKKSSTFTVSYPYTPNLITALFSYFKNRQSDYNNHIRIFSYRFVEAPAAQTRETFFLAKTDGEPEQLREIYYWLYDEAVKHGFSPEGNENMGCYSYKKDSKEWLLLGNGSSYHEDDFLHSPNYALAAKARFYHVFQTHPEKMDKLKKRFPDSFGRPWTQCYKCKAKWDGCKYRVIFKQVSQDYYHCGRHHHLYFHDPTLEDVKAILELYKLENNIKSYT